ncbi:hypothetical protein CQA40_06650 [Helicobacter sp. MIT 01-3238]|nr:hypothetical protein CQA40_06650 [Helicobacter sp. MIT 01-3238]
MQVNLVRILALNSLKYHKTLAFLDFDFSFGIFTFYKVCPIQYTRLKIAYQNLKIQKHQQAKPNTRGKNAKLKKDR